MPCAFCGCEVAADGGRLVHHIDPKPAPSGEKYTCPGSGQTLELNRELANLNAFFDQRLVA